MSDQPADDAMLRRAQESIDDAKAAAADVVEPEEDTLVDEGAPVADHAEPADGPAPAA
ncbi:hypothetical protein DEI99_001405 [Curtobacterium sp. MCLR17_036]|uniref:hypothetical protein n=1 Tax=Curtobacterium sp. MCLR17_036 TaxID=2175620 RepID=UPI0015E8E122|nr:hypothetical protein [Curtobacterium sp. MCLR17_036]WIE65212.1 hypothetical protein DEI99_001405 [Curtobacterium sp. MCLR17_036]